MSVESAKRRRVLVVDDEEDQLKAYRRFFAQHEDEFSVALVSDGEKALGVLGGEPVDILVLDWSLPGISGASLAKAVRSQALTRSIGILMVTGKSSSAETIFALDSGADDFLPKPVDWGVLLARLRSLIRRSELTLGRRLTKTFPGLELDFDADRLTVDGAPTGLSRKEMALLRVFLLRPDILHAQAFLWEAVWGYEADGWEHTLSVTLSSLRGKLGSKWGSRLKAHKGKGYVFET